MWLEDEEEEEAITSRAFTFILDVIASSSSILVVNHAIRKTSTPKQMSRTVDSAVSLFTTYWPWELHANLYMRARAKKLFTSPPPVQISHCPAVKRTVTARSCACCGVCSALQIDTIGGSIQNKLKGINVGIQEGPNDITGCAGGESKFVDLYLQQHGQVPFGSKPMNT